MSRSRRTVLRALAVGPVAAWCRPAPGAPAAGGAEAPVNWPALTRLDGEPWRVPSAADGRPCAVVAVIWSTTCPFCLRHNAHVDKLHRLADGRALAVVTAALDHDTGRVPEYLRRHGYRFPVVREADRLRALFTARRIIPFTVTVARDGRVQERVPGEMAEDDVLGLLRRLA
jgi:hypothetical protein